MVCVGIKVPLTSEVFLDYNLTKRNTFVGIAIIPAWSTTSMCACVYRRKMVKTTHTTIS